MLKDFEHDLPFVTFQAFNPHILKIFPHRDLAYWNDDFAVRYCKLSDPEKSFELVKLNQVPEHMVVSEDEKLIAFSLSSRELRVWDCESKSLRDDLFPHAEQIRASTYFACEPMELVCCCATLAYNRQVCRATVSLASQMHGAGGFTESVLTDAQARIHFGSGGTGDTDGGSRAEGIRFACVGRCRIGIVLASLCARDSVYRYSDWIES